MKLREIFFDIETECLPVAEIEGFMPEFSAPGNYRDLEKIKANIAEQKIEWLERGALSALTARVLCIGIESNDAFELLEDADESALLRRWWELTGTWIWSARPLVGFCCRSFDLPMLIRRSWHHGLKVPDCIWTIHGSRFVDNIIDVAERWACGSKDTRDRVSLDNLSKHLGTGFKSGNGRDFASLWRTERPAAEAYLRQDLKLTRLAYLRLMAPGGRSNVAATDNDRQ